MRAASRMRKIKTFLAISLEPRFVAAGMVPEGSRRIRAIPVDDLRSCVRRVHKPQNAVLDEVACECLAFG